MIMKTLFLIALIAMCGCISAKHIYVYDENGNKIFFKEYSNVLYVERNPQQLEKNVAADIKSLRSSALKIDSTAEYYRMEMKSMPQLPSDLTIGRELLYGSDSMIQYLVYALFRRHSRLCRGKVDINLLSINSGISAKFNNDLGLCNPIKVKYK